MYLSPVAFARIINNNDSSHLPLFYGSQLHCSLSLSAICTIVRLFISLNICLLPIVFLYWLPPTLSVNLSVFFNCLSVCRTAYLSVCLCVCVSVKFFVCPNLSFFWGVCLVSLCLYISCLCVDLSAGPRLSAFICVCFSAFPFSTVSHSTSV